MLKSVLITLLALLAILQYQLWFGEGSLPSVWPLRAELSAQREHNQHARAHNAAIAADIHSLKSDLAAVEARARRELGMIKRGETFYYVVDTSSTAERDNSRPSPPPNASAP